jgi:uncharacterized protein
LYGRGVKVLYCHGFASGPLSSKGRAVREHLGRRGIEVELLDLRVPSREELRLSRMIEVVQAAIDDQAVAIGASLGALTVARAAERDARIVAAVLLAPAFRLVERWRGRMGEEEWGRWQREGTYAYDDHTTPGSVLQIDFGFMEDLGLVDVGWPELRIPTTIVQGSRDDLVDPELVREFAAGRENVRLVEVDDGHQLLESLDVIHAEIEKVLTASGVRVA